MSKTSRFLIQFLIAGFIVFFLVGPVWGQSTDSNAAVNDETAITDVDEGVIPEELGVKEPIILPDNPLYLFKEWGRKIQQVLVRGETKKTLLLQKQVNQRLYDAYKAIKKDPAVLDKIKDTLDKNDTDLETLKDKVSQLNTDQLLEKFSDSTVGQDQLLRRIMARVKENPEAVQALRDRLHERFGQLLNNLDETKIDEIVSKIKPQLNSIEVLKRVEGKVENPQAKEVLRRNYESKLDRISENLTPEAVQNFLEEVTTPEDSSVSEEIVQEAEETINDPARVKALERIRTEVKNRRQPESQLEPEDEE